MDVLESVGGQDGRHYTDHQQRDQHGQVLAQKTQAGAPRRRTLAHAADPQRASVERRHVESGSGLARRGAAPPSRKKTPARRKPAAEIEPATDTVAELAEADPEESPEAFMARREAARKKAPAAAAAAAPAAKEGE